MTKRKTMDRDGREEKKDDRSDHKPTAKGKPAPIELDSNRNLITGQNVRIDNRSMNNQIFADNAILVNSHNNLVHAKNVEIRNSSGLITTGADHLIGTPDEDNPPPAADEANYSVVEGDAHVVRAYASVTKGFGNKNFCSYGVCEGNTCTLGDPARPNFFRSSSARGERVTVVGNNSHGIGSNFSIEGDDIIVIGKGNGEIFSSPGVFLLNQMH